MVVLVVLLKNGKTVQTILILFLQQILQTHIRIGSITVNKDGVLTYNVSANKSFTAYFNVTNYTGFYFRYDNGKKYAVIFADLLADGGKRLYDDANHLHSDTGGGAHSSSVYDTIPNAEETLKKYKKSSDKFNGYFGQREYIELDGDLTNSGRFWIMTNADSLSGRYYGATIWYGACYNNSSVKEAGNFTGQWTTPSILQWKIFSKNLNITKTNYSSFGLSASYFTSTYQYIVNFPNGVSAEHVGDGSPGYYCRMAATY